MIDFDLPQAAVCAFIMTPDDQILSVTRRNTKIWSLPGGKVDPGEEPINALVREIYEETGIKFKKTDFIPIYSEVVVGDDGKDFYCTAYWMHAFEYPEQNGDTWSVEDGINVSFIPLNELLIKGAFSDFNNLALYSLSNIQRYQNIRHDRFETL